MKGITFSHKSNDSSEKSCYTLNELIIHAVYQQYNYASNYNEAALLACEVLSVGRWLSKFERIVSPLFSRVSSPAVQHLCP